MAKLNPNKFWQEAEKFTSVATELNEFWQEAEKFTSVATEPDMCLLLENFKRMT